MFPVCAKLPQNISSTFKHSNLRNSQNLNIFTLNIIPPQPPPIPNGVVVCSDLLCIFVSEKITMSIAICILQPVTPNVTRHHTPPCFEGVGPLSEDGVPDPRQHRDGSIYKATGAVHCLYSSKPRGFRRVQPLYR